MSFCTCGLITPVTHLILKSVLRRHKVVHLFSQLAGILDIIFGGESHKAGTTMRLLLSCRTGFEGGCPTNAGSDEGASLSDVGALVRCLWTGDNHLMHAASHIIKAPG